MYDHQIQEDFFYMMLYGAVAMMSLMASCYLLFRRANAIAPDVTSSVRLRRWTAAFFACMTLSHLWYLPVAFHTSSEEILQCYLVGAMLDFMTLIPCAIVLLLVLLQDHRRPLWPVGVMVAPVIIGLAVSLVYSYFDIMPQFYGYHLLLAIGLIIYMVRATRQYGHWLRDNYADLEHKEFWQSILVLAIFLLTLLFYGSTSSNKIYLYAIQVVNILVVGLLMWRVETLRCLDSSDTVAEEPPKNDKETPSSNSAVPYTIGPQLKKYCEDTLLFLQYDLTLAQLAQAIGTNRYYLSQYFSRQGLTYNAYINGLRVEHFIRLYHRAVACHRAFTANQLSAESGFHSYSTFSAAFKQKMGKTVTAWMTDAKE